MNFEGILISKIPYKERDLIGKILTRRGTIQTFYFYGGRGGGKKMKPSLLELGRMLKIEAKVKNKNAEEMLTASEVSVLWEGRKIRENYEAFVFMCFVLELVSKISVQDDHEEGESHFEGIFKATSNALFYLNDALEKKNFSKNIHYALFLSKIIQELGIASEEELLLLLIPYKEYETVPSFKEETVKVLFKYIVDYYQLEARSFKSLIN